MSKGFRYALEPLRLARSWTVDDALAELANEQRNVALACEALDALLARLEQVRADWIATQSGGAALALDRMALLARYLDDGARQRAALERELATLEARRDAAAARAAAAQRALDAVEEHRDGQRLAFRRERANADLKTADEHWNALHGRKTEHELDA
jgi:flagellar biosynthesis chaperone FliJ